MQKALSRIIATTVIGFGGAVALAPTEALAVACSTITTVEGWETAGSCTIGDKKFTFIDSDLDDLPPLDDFTISFNNAGLNYSFNGASALTGIGDAAADNEFIEYEIEVIGSGFKIVSVALDSNVNNLGSAATTVTKLIYDDGGALLDTLVSTDGTGPINSIAISETKLRIRDNIVMGLDDVLQGFNNSFKQTPAVPEPATLALLGASLVGLGVLSRRRRA